MDENDRQVRAELASYGSYHCPHVPSGDFVTFELWGNGLTQYVYKYVNDKGQEDEETYREEGYGEKLR